MQQSTRATIYVLSLLLSISATSQVGIGTTTPEAALDVKSSDKGILFPRVELSSYTDVSTIVDPRGGSLPPGTFVFNIGASGLAPTGYYLWDGNNWINIKGIRQGDLKYSVQTQDHNGWYLVNGRALNTLPATAQIAASQLGLTSTLPNAADSYLKGKTSTETLASIVGSNSRTLTTANIPSFSANGTTEYDGGHTHPNTTTANNERHGHTWQEKGTTDWFYGKDGSLSVPVFTSSSTRSSGASGSHSHNFNTNPSSHNHTATATYSGAASSFNTKPNSLAVNIFIFLGE
ncbi:hypothetical protein K8089_07320 [Aequorivita sp. F47161]|uniref:Microcystin-dependent protein n=1 Tax=Aequorivita vitellina TaxID=2874475 RepID=A0A9X1QXB8_9FLAO|nr:hypothetical protein [Aequorivita vitellina]MCG2418828.1 hypothetical protein [Aequorivita vitellina]